MYYETSFFLFFFLSFFLQCRQAVRWVIVSSTFTLLLLCSHQMFVMADEEEAKKKVKWRKWSFTSISSPLNVSQSQINACDLPAAWDWVTGSLLLALLLSLCSLSLSSTLFLSFSTVCRKSEDKSCSNAPVRGHKWPRSVKCSCSLHLSVTPHRFTTPTCDESGWRWTWYKSLSNHITCTSHFLFDSLSLATDSFLFDSISFRWTFHLFSNTQSTWHQVKSMQSVSMKLTEKTALFLRNVYKIHWMIEKSRGISSLCFFKPSVLILYLHDETNKENAKDNKKNQHKDTHILTVTHDAHLTSLFIWWQMSLVIQEK